RGRGTEYLAALRPGDGLDVLGPLGRGFAKPPRGARPMLVAGGIGVGPMLYLAATLATDAAAGLCEAPILVVGARTAALVPAAMLPAGTAVCTDDGSAGFSGTVTDWLASFDPGLPPAFYACGPTPMMAAVAAVAASRRAPYEASVEQWMACGVGACAGCAVRLRSGEYAKACSDGPVLDGSTVDWEAMA
ncbi:MAG TPA: dihydroorotate dehydrogenase electron transfer subunit, partial [Spirochaetales bacterium]|nr:dihydroorotate dehydrogenase electron transfer subunit [Spirochaetales bacterium]